ncbi:MAG: hypothetical protein KatS3mg118_1635 [Paracoccaceae bacterium]|nr:MAG: hypothetical protein KatS3mg118_1635 [Paracoccaceae bacterium]
MSSWGKEDPAESGLNVIAADDLADAAKKIVEGREGLSHMLRLIAAALIAAAPAAAQEGCPWGGAVRRANQLHVDIFVKRTSCCSRASTATRPATSRSRRSARPPAGRIARSMPTGPMRWGSRWRCTAFCPRPATGPRPAPPSGSVRPPPRRFWAETRRAATRRATARGTRGREDGRSGRREHQGDLPGPDRRPGHLPYRAGIAYGTKMVGGVTPGRAAPPISACRSSTRWPRRAPRPARRHRRSMCRPPSRPTRSWRRSTPRWTDRRASPRASRCWT